MSNTSLGRSLSKLYELFCENGGAVTTDSRAVASLVSQGKAQGISEDTGPIFFALQGDNFDGNDYAVRAVADGAGMAVVQGRLPRGVEAESAEKERYLVVDDTLMALQELAACHRDVLGLPVIALTGSNGKTTTKELIARVLGTRYRVAATRGNLNNHIGVPLTLLSITEEDDVAIVEMGANHRGEIAALCSITQPNIGLITNIGRAHLEGFGGEDGVRSAKGELYDYLASHDGTAIYSADNSTLTDMIGERSFGAEEGAIAVSYSLSGLGIAAADVTIDRLVIAVQQEADAGRLKEVTTHLVGDYNIFNVAAVVAVGQYFGVEVAAAVEAVAGYVPDNNRSQVAVSTHGTGNTLYMDAYNANPSSMAVAIDNFSGLDAESFEGGKVIVLGDMRELGEFSGVEHRAIIERLLPVVSRSEQRVTCYLVGSEFREALGEREVVGVRVFDTAAEMVDALTSKNLIIRDSLVLVKGSRGLALEQLYPLL